MVWKDSYEPATGCARRFRFEPEQEPTSARVSDEYRRATSLTICLNTHMVKQLHRGRHNRIRSGTAALLAVAAWRGAVPGALAEGGRSVRPIDPVGL
jgi:hypothetical protein